MTDPTPTPAAGYGGHSEVGQLRKVLVCAPGLAHERLTPSNCDDLLFDDVIWVQNARREQHAKLFTQVEWALFLAVIAAAVYGIYGLATGVITI